MVASPYTYFGLALAMLAFASTTEPTELWFALTYLFLFVSFIRWIYIYLHSNSFKRLFGWAWKLGCFIGIIGICVASIFVVRLVQVGIELKKEEGKLYPADDPIPKNGCSGIAKDTSSFLFMGSETAIINKFPKTLIRKLGNDILVLDKNKDGSLAISLDVRSKNGDIIVQMIRGEFTINQTNRFKMERGDRSSLKVNDQKGNIALDVKYFNPRAIWINFNTDNIDIRGKIDEISGNCAGGLPEDGTPLFDLRIDIPLRINPTLTNPFDFYGFPGS